MQRLSETIHRIKYNLNKERNNNMFVNEILSLLINTLIKTTRPKQISYYAYKNCISYETALHKSSKFTTYYFQNTQSH
jgi:hypothetical protein